MQNAEPIHAGQEATVKTEHGTTDWPQTGKGVHQGCILPPYLFNLCMYMYMQSIHLVKCWLDESRDRIKIARRNINNLRYEDDTTLMAENEEELKSILMKVKEESEKAGLKLTIQKTKITASSHITSRQIDEETMETGKILFSWAPKSLRMVTAVMKLKDVCSLEEKL